MQHACQTVLIQAETVKAKNMIVNATVGRVGGELIVRTSHPWMAEKITRKNKRHYDEGATGTPNMHASDLTTLTMLAIPSCTCAFLKGEQECVQQCTNELALSR